jgi:hypothetical protein
LPKSTYEKETVITQKVPKGEIPVLNETKKTDAMQEKTQIKNVIPNAYKF